MTSIDQHLGQNTARDSQELVLGVIVSVCSPFELGDKVSDAVRCVDVGRREAISSLELYEK